jgi:hypothetical protein
MKRIELSMDDFPGFCSYLRTKDLFLSNIIYYFDKIDKLIFDSIHISRA